MLNDVQTSTEAAMVRAVKKAAAMIDEESFMLTESFCSVGAVFLFAGLEEKNNALCEYVCQSIEALHTPVQCLLSYF